ncbi:MAG: hypothetical protein IJM34_03765 [Lachnospiraceae bacterium]|nr:hypothetical protein [Lachnospiraceae bacterium]
MKMLFNAFAKKVFGVKFEGLIKPVFISVIMFAGLKGAGINLNVAAFVLYLTAAVFSAGVMWKALNSNDFSQSFSNMIMMPFPKKAFVFIYVSVLGFYTICTKLIIVLALIFSVHVFEVPQIICCVLAALCAVYMCAAFFVIRRAKIIVLLWAAAVLASIFLLKDMGAYPMIAVFGISLLIALIIIVNTGAYVFYDTAVNNESVRSVVKSRRHALVWVYLFRYMLTHKNYITNSLVMWAIACILPLYLKFIGMQNMLGAFLYMGFGIVLMNTPIAILISCDPDLERSIKEMPGAAKFFIPYGLFVFAYNIISVTIYLLSWQLQQGGIGISYIVLGALLAAVGAVLTMLLEYFAPVKDWKIESDLWHAPRKYIVPAVLILLAAGWGALSGGLF